MEEAGVGIDAAAVLKPEDEETEAYVEVTSWVDGV